MNLIFVTPRDQSKEDKSVFKKMVRKWARLKEITNYLIGCQIFDGASEDSGSSGGDCFILHTPDEGWKPGTVHDHTKGVAAAI